VALRPHSTRATPTPTRARMSVSVSWNAAFIVIIVEAAEIDRLRVSATGVVMFADRIRRLKVGVWKLPDLPLTRSASDINYHYGPSSTVYDAVQSKSIEYNIIEVVFTWARRTCPPLDFRQFIFSVDFGNAMSDSDFMRLSLQTF